MRAYSMKPWWALAALMFMFVLTVSLVAQQTSSLTIAGQPGSAKVVQIDGRNYVEVEGLARLTNSSMSFNANQIVLTMPGSTVDASASATHDAGFSKDFVAAGIEAMSQVREWRAALSNAIQHSYPLSEDGLAAYRDQARKTLRLASVAVNTPADKSVFPFLTNEFNNMQKLSDKYLQIAKSMTYIEPNSLDSDPLDQKIQTCAHSLASMATANQFVDDGSCQ
jgi:hypothetical protein